ncbi:phage scaffolding protein [Companilactobacillus muriivasis]|uniref:phage scaffolding protein n=1 Tax=Companilactobacillus muriivasis TaxID=3081444 RepID=UPI0030C68501
MKREFLKDLGLTDEVIEKVMSEHGKDVQDVNSKLASAEQERDSFKSQVDDRDNQIKGLSDKADNNEELNSQIEKLQSTIKENDQKAADNLLQVKQDNAVTNYLKDSGVRDVKAKVK